MMNLEEATRLEDYAVDGVVPILEEETYIPKYEPKQRDKYNKRCEMTDLEKAARRREQNRLASKRARLKKFNQRKFLKKATQELHARQNNLVKRLELYGMNPSMYIQGILPSSTDNTDKDVKAMSGQLISLMKTVKALMEMLKSVSEDRQIESKDDLPDDQSKLPTLPPLPKLIVSKKEGDTEMADVSRKDKPAPQQQQQHSMCCPKPHCQPPYSGWNYGHFPYPPTPNDCYYCAVTMGYGCSNCVGAHSAAPHQAFMPGFPQLQHPTIPQTAQQPQPQQNAEQAVDMSLHSASGKLCGHPSCTTCTVPFFEGSDSSSKPPPSQWPEVCPASFSNGYKGPSMYGSGDYAMGGYMGYSDAYVNSHAAGATMEFSSRSQQFQYPF